MNVVWKGRTLMTPIGGGVHIQPQLTLSAEQLQADETGQLQQLREQTGIQNLPKDRWWWD